MGFNELEKSVSVKGEDVLYIRAEREKLELKRGLTD